MQIAVQYWCKENVSVVTESGFRFRSTQSVLKRTEILVGKKEDIFKVFDEKNNQLKYCNGSYYKFEDKTIQEEYIKWYKTLSNSVKFDMCYGNGIVD